MAGWHQRSIMGAAVGYARSVTLFLDRIPAAGGAVSLASSAGTAISGLSLEYLEMVSVEADKELWCGEEEDGTNGDAGAEIEGLHLRNENKFIAEAVGEVEQTIHLHRLLTGGEIVFWC